MFAKSIASSGITSVHLKKSQFITRVQGRQDTFAYQASAAVIFTRGRKAPVNFFMSSFVQPPQVLSFNFSAETKDTMFTYIFFYSRKTARSTCSLEDT